VFEQRRAWPRGDLFVARRDVEKRDAHPGGGQQREHTSTAWDHHTDGGPDCDRIAVRP
jgi:hypothetical protein